MISSIIQTGIRTGICLLIMITIMKTDSYAGSDIYFYIDENGAYHYTNVPNSDRYTPSKKLSSPSLDKLSNNTYDAIIRKAANTHQIDFALVKAVIKAESSFNPNAISRAGAQGLMQIMPANFESFAIINPFDPEENITAGTRYLKYLMDRYNQDLRLALAAYNAGPGAVDRYGDIPPFQETRGYVQRVLSYYDRISHSSYNDINTAKK